MKIKKQSDREYYIKNREHLIKKASIYNIKNKDKRKKKYPNFKSSLPEARRARYLKLRYGLTNNEYNELVLIQQNKCSICLKISKRLVVDHNHKNNKVRSLLCTTCNAGLGQFKDDILLLNKAIGYLKKHNK